MLRQYPDLTAQAFRAEAARLHGLIPDNIIATKGGDELLRLALTTFLPTGSPLGLAEPSYSLYPVLAAVHDSPICAPSTRLCGPCFSSEAMVAFADIPFFFNVSLDQTEGDSQYPDFRNVQ